MSKFRGFIAIEVNATQKILDFENEIKNTEADVKLVEPENIHVTLKFLGDVEENLVDSIEKIMKDAVDEINPFQMKLKGTGVFPNQNYIKVIWIGIEEYLEIEKIVSNMDNQLSKIGFKKEKREFSPHLTVGRVKTAKNKDRIIEIVEKYRDVEFSTFTVNSITLKKSDLTSKGPIYTTIKEVKF